MHHLSIRLVQFTKLKKMLKSITDTNIKRNCKKVCKTSFLWQNQIIIEAGFNSEKKEFNRLTKKNIIIKQYLTYNH